MASAKKVSIVAKIAQSKPVKDGAVSLPKFGGIAKANVLKVDCPTKFNAVSFVGQIGV
jgi:hypothetical protein